MNIKTLHNVTDTTRVVGGEIVTSPQFQSVKDAVNLFGESAFSEDKPSIQNKALAKGTGLHLSQKEVHKLKSQIQNADTTKSQALAELENAKETLDNLSKKFQSITESRKSAMKDSEGGGVLEEDSISVISVRTDWKEHLEGEKEQCVTSTPVLDTTNQIKDTNYPTKPNMENAVEIFIENSGIQESILQEQEFDSEIAENPQLEYPGRVSEMGSFQTEMENTRVSELETLAALGKEFEYDIAENLRLIKGVHNSNLDYVKIVATELENAKAALQKAKEEESSLRDLLESLKLQLENVKREHFELKKKECLSESITGKLHVKLRKSKSDLEEEQSKVSGSCNERISSFDELWQEAEEMKKEQSEHEESEENLRIVPKESESKIVLSREEFESLIHKSEEADMISNMRIMAANAEAEALKARESETLKTLKMFEKEKENVRSATQEALKKASMAEMGKRAAEEELRKKKIERMSEIASISKMESESEMEKVNIPKLQKRNSRNSRTLVLPNLGAMFHRRKNGREEGSETILSYLGEDMFF